MRGRTGPRVADHSQMRTRANWLGKMQPECPRGEAVRWEEVFG